MMKYQPICRQVIMQTTGIFISLESLRKGISVCSTWLITPTWPPKMTLNTSAEATTAQT